MINLVEVPLEAIRFDVQKGKAYDKLPFKSLRAFPDTKYLVSIKYDGNQIFIVKIGKIVRVFTSDWKEFILEGIANELSKLSFDFVIIGEFMYGCEGKLGDRRKSAILTTLRTNFNKGIKNNIDEDKVNIRAFDFMLYTIYGQLDSIIYRARIAGLQQSISCWPSQIKPIEYKEMTGREAIEYSLSLRKDGWEGVMVVEPNTLYHFGKRVNHSIKLKFRPTADLLCVGVNPGNDKYEGMIGSLKLRDSRGRVVNPGSGISDEDRAKPEDYFIGKVFEIEYEQIMDTYVQPVIVRERKDKTKEEID